MTQTNVFNPDDWLLSTTRAIKEYAQSMFNSSYEIIMEFPSTNAMQKRMPISKTIVHFEIDAIDERPIGFGGVFGNYNYDSGAKVSKLQEAGLHVINFDCGAWASDRSGGTTSRMRVKQILTLLFQGMLAQQRLDDAASVGDGRIEIVNFTGGRFLTDTINDVDVYRLTDCSLDLRVYSRTPLALATTIETVEGIDQDENLEIGGIPIS